MALSIDHDTCIMNLNKKTEMENKYEQGAVVFSKENPSRKMNVRRYVDRIYFCTVQNDPAQNVLIFWERDLIPDKIRAELF